MATTLQRFPAPEDPEARPSRNIRGTRSVLTVLERANVRAVPPGLLDRLHHNNRVLTA